MSTALVSLVNGIPTTTSQKVAEVFGKTHDKVCRDIRNLLKDEPEWCAANFGETSFEVHQPNGGTRKTAMYTMTRQGMTLLVMGYTGPKARHFKIAYIQAFDCMEEQLKAMQAAPTLPPLSTVEDRRKLNNLVREWAALSGQSFPDCWAEVHVAFDIEAVADLPAALVRDAEKWVQARLREYYAPAPVAPDFPLELANCGRKGKEIVNLWAELEDLKKKLAWCNNMVFLACSEGRLMHLTAEKNLLHTILKESVKAAQDSLSMAQSSVQAALRIKAQVDFHTI
jgi:Rha family phage regulatory protein